MGRSRFATLAFVCIASVMLLAASPLPAPQTQSILGQHTVRAGETLYCIGRGYGVLPSAIASANSLSATARLAVGQVLAIPAMKWVGIPAGPVCAPQFASPYTGTGATGPTATPIPATPSTTTTTSARYTVQRGDTLWRIGRTFGVTVNAIKAANNLRSNLIYAGQVLIIPGATGELQGVPPSQPNCHPSYPTRCIPPPPPDLDCFTPEVPFANFPVLPPDPHGFDADGDGVGCESTTDSPPPSTNCDPAYPMPVCIPPPPPDLNCFTPEVPYTNFVVLPPDPHNFDGDGDGIGCET